MTGSLLHGALAVLGGPVVSLALAAGTQDSGQASPPVFRSGVELVRVDVRVTDATDVPIRDLKPDEVEVFEEGEPRPVLLFQRVTRPAGTYVEAAWRTIAAEVSTNEGAPRGNVYVLVFDQSHITPGNEQRARQAAQRFLRTRAKPGDRIALYALPGPGPQIDFTADVSRALDELISVRGTWQDTGTGSVSTMRIHEAYEITRGNQEILTRVAERTAATIVGSDTRPGAARGGEDAALRRRLALEDARTLVARADGEARQFLLMLADVVATLRAVEGRKAVILFSEGFPVDNVSQELLKVAAAAAQSYSVVYALDLNQRLVSVSDELPRGGEIASEIQSRLQMLGSLTAETDGELFTDASPRLDRIMNRISEASQDYYLVGFPPSAAGLRDRQGYRRIRVAVKRPGARVSSRTGYAVGSVTGPLNKRNALDAALKAPFSQQGLRVEYTTYVLRGSTQGDLHRVMLSLAAELPVASAGSSTADVVFAVRDVGTGKLAASGADTIALAAAPRPGATTATGYCRVQFELPPGVYLMRAIVREPGGLLGSADRRFQVRSLGGPGVTASDLVIASADVAGLPVRAALYADGVVSGVSEIYGRTAEQLESAVVEVELLPVGSTTAIVATHAELQPAVTGPAGASRVARIELPLEGVVPGEYVMRATVRANGETAAELLRDVAILAGTRPAELPAARGADAVDPHALTEGEIFRKQVARARDEAAGVTAPAAAFAARGAWGDAERALAGADESAPATARLAGLVRYARRNYMGAAAAWRAALAAEPGDAPTLFLLGWAQVASGDERAAIGTWRAAALADPALVPAYLALVDAYLRLDQRLLALQVVRVGLQALPDSRELRDRLAGLEAR